jgi:hypothetical protein
MTVQADPQIICPPLIVIEAEISREVTISEVIIWVATLEAEKTMSDRFILMGPKDPTSLETCLLKIKYMLADGLLKLRNRPLSPT